MNMQKNFPINETFLEILINHKQQKINALILLEPRGVISVEGLIRIIYLDVKRPYLELESGTKILLRTIRAVNEYLLPATPGNQHSRN